MTKNKFSTVALLIIVVGFIFLGVGTIKILEGKFGTLRPAEHESCANFAAELTKNHSEYLKFDPEPYSTCKEGVLKRNYFEALRLVVLGVIIVVGGILLKLLFK